MPDDDYAGLEAEAEQWLGDNPDHGAAALIKQLRQATKRAENRGYEKAKTEFTAQQARETVYARLGIPAAVRPLFQGIDPTNETALKEQVEALKALGLKVGADSPETPTQQAATQQQAQPNEMLQAQQAMVQAEAGGKVSGQDGDLATRMQQMEANPGKYSDEQRDGAIQELNAQIRAAAQASSGALG